MFDVRHFFSRHKRNFRSIQADSVAIGCFYIVQIKIKPYIDVHINMLIIKRCGWQIAQRGHLGNLLFSGGDFC